MIRIITAACGHVSGFEAATMTQEQVRSRIALLEDRKCPACQAGDAATQAVIDGLPQLAGTERQIAWAATLRTKLLAEFDHIELLADKAGSPSLPTVRRLKAELRAQSDARYWIAHRGVGAKQLVATAFQREQSAAGGR